MQPKDNGAQLLAIVTDIAPGLTNPAALPDQGPAGLDYHLRGLPIAGCLPSRLAEPVQQQRRENPYGEDPCQYQDGALHRFFGAELDRPPGHEALPATPHLPRLAVTVLGATLAGFLAGSLLGISPVWVAAAGAAAITVPALVRRTATPRDVVRAIQPSFLLFVLGLGVTVAAASGNGLATAVRTILPSGTSLPALLGIAAISALLANLVNNLLADAQAALGREAVLDARSGRIEREVVAAAGTADLILFARDKDHTHPGPRSLGPTARYVLDHAPCAVLLVWPDAPSG